MKMLHVTIQTEKFEAEVQFYLSIVGLKMITDMRPMGMQMVFLADNEGDTEIEIIENPEAKPIETEFLSIGFKTDNIEKKYDELKALGFGVSEMINPNPNVRFFFVKDPDGASVQFI